jgi:hypothetical protein
MPDRVVEGMPCIIRHQLTLFENRYFSGVSVLMALIAICAIVALVNRRQEDKEQAILAIEQAAQEPEKSFVDSPA